MGIRILHRIFKPPDTPAGNNDYVEPGATRPADARQISFRRTAQTHALAESYGIQSGNDIRTIFDFYERNYIPAAGDYIYLCPTGMPPGYISGFQYFISVQAQILPGKKFCE